MGTKTPSPVLSELQKWDKIFQGLIKMLKTQQHQLETLAKKRKILGDRVEMRYERWVSDVRLYKHHISQMRTDLETKEMARLLEAAKAEMMVGLKHREAYLRKLKLEETADELTDFRIWNPNETKKAMSRRKDSGCESVTLRTLEGDLRRLKLEYENLASEKSSQVAAIMAGNKFARNQFNIMETQLTDKFDSKHSELEKAKRKIEALFSNIEELRSSNAEKEKR